MDRALRTQIPNESDERSVAALASRQHGVFSRAQALELGFSSSRIHRRLESGRWDSPLRGVYRIAGGPVTELQRAIVAALWAGPGALVSHRAAAALWELGLSFPRQIDLWIPSARDRRTTGVVVHRGGRLDRADRALLDGIPLTTPVRTIIDLAGRLEDERLEALVERAVHEGKVSIERLDARLAALGGSGRPGTGRLGAILGRRRALPALESVLEVRVWRLLCASGLPRPARQHEVSARGRRYRLDFAWPGQRLALECDGWGAHGGRQSFHADRSRLGDLVASGWRVLPVTWTACVDSPDELLARVRGALAAPAVSSLRV
jgi:very-short-patch-repair endonuclease